MSTANDNVKNFFCLDLNCILSNHLITKHMIHVEEMGFTETIKQ